MTTDILASSISWPKDPLQRRNEGAIFLEKPWILNLEPISNKNFKDICYIDEPKDNYSKITPLSTTFVQLRILLIDTFYLHSNLGL